MGLAVMLKFTLVFLFLTLFLVGLRPPRSPVPPPPRGGVGVFLALRGGDVPCDFLNPYSRV